MNYSGKFDATVSTDGVGAYSGGQVGKNNAPLQDPSNAPAAIVAHGKDGTGGDIDYLNIDIYKTSLTWEHEIRAAGGFAIDCGDQSSHVDIATRTAIAAFHRTSGALSCNAVRSVTSCTSPGSAPSA